MDCAAFGGWNLTLNLLIDFEADIDPKDKAGVSIIIFDIIVMFTLLLFKVTPLQLACQEGHLKVVEVLLKNGAKVSNKNSNHLNSLDIAVENGHK